jgi:hypothetical protein
MTQHENSVSDLLFKRLKSNNVPVAFVFSPRITLPSTINLQYSISLSIGYCKAITIGEDWEQRSDSSTSLKENSKNEDGLYFEHRDVSTSQAQS